MAQELLFITEMVLNARLEGQHDSCCPVVISAKTGALNDQSFVALGIGLVLVVGRSGCTS